MGLDISVYSGLAPALEESDDTFTPNPNKDFPGRDAGLENGPYTYAGCHNFRAGSYCGYNQWREQLARLAGYPLVMSAYFKCPRHDAGAEEKGNGPFFELIHFSDCEGVIGPVVAAKLANDFAEFQEKANSFDGEVHGGWFQELYAKWRKAFETAANGGAVDFH